MASVTEGVRHDLARLSDPALGESALAQTALALAAELEEPGNSATSKAFCAKELRETLDRLRSLAPPKIEKDGIDDLTARRAKRLRGAAASS